MSTNTDYVVKRGDTLSKIARFHETTPHEIASLNALNSIDRIRIGQRLTIPAKRVQERKESRPSAATPPEKSLFVQVVDVLNAPVEGMRIMLEQAGEQLIHTTDALGRAPELAVKDAASSVSVMVERVTGGWKSIAEVQPTEEVTFIRLRSPKVHLSSSLLAHEGNGPSAGTKKPAPQAPGTVTVVMSKAGHPVQSVALECPNPENLRLGPNFKHRQIVLAAAKRSGLSAQSIAAVMNAEAATIVRTHAAPVVDKKTGQPVLDKNGKPKVKTWKENTGEWDPKSTANSSSARGMTQFLDASWLEQAFQPGTFLNKKIKAEGWLTSTSIQVKTGKTIQERTVPAFKLSDGQLVTKQPLARTLSLKPHMTAYATASDANLQKLLDLRFDPEFAIQTAVDYGMQNLMALQNGGYKVAALNDGEKAKMLYLTHHLGLSDARKFIMNTMTAERAKYLLRAQVGDAAAEQKADVYNGDYLQAHRNWLKNFVDSRITLLPRMCDAAGAPPVRDLISISVSVRPTSPRNEPR